jgi:hypothetical protein
MTTAQTNKAKSKINFLATRCEEILGASAHPPVADVTDASSERVSQINTSRHKPCCHSSAGRKRRCSERHCVRLFFHTAGHNSTKTDNRTRRCLACNMRSDNNNRYHTPSHMGPLRIRPEKSRRRPHKGLIARMLVHGAWVSFSFSSDVPFLQFCVSLSYLGAAFRFPRLGRL